MHCPLSFTCLFGFLVRLLALELVLRHGKGHVQKVLLFLLVGSLQASSHGG